VRWFNGCWRWNGELWRWVRPAAAAMAARAEGGMAVRVGGQEDGGRAGPRDG
jgi:hypothetical protein